jgi:4-amino-4-deoxy-L-arabinose transferase-like glycosyltransferase
MTPARTSRFSVPLALPWLCVLCAAYLLPGLAGHDPWKSDDAIGFGIAFEALNGQWLVPALAGEPYPEASPLYFWIAAILAKLASAVLPLHAAARLASGTFAAIAIVCAGLAARELFGSAAANSAALILIGCIGLLLHAHSMTAEIALLAALSAVFLGIAIAPRRPGLGGGLAGGGIGAMFLAKGFAPAVAGLLIVAILTLALPGMRRRAARFWIVLAAVMLPCASIWPFALYHAAPERLADWWIHSNLVNLPGTSSAPFVSQILSYLRLLGWFAWPALPLALWSLWIYRHRLTHPGIVLPVAGFGVLLVMLGFGRDAREVTALPLLLPLSLLGAAAVGELRRGAANALDWFSMMTFSLFALALWVGYAAMLTGLPAELANRFATLEPGFAAKFSPFAFSLAIVYSTMWVLLVTGAGRSNYRGVTHWAAGMTLAWGLLVALWVPWVDYGKSYRGMSAALAPHVNPRACVSSRNLGEPQRASLHYFIGLVTLRADGGPVRCPLLLVQGSVSDDTGNPGRGWDLVWQGNRPGDRVERYRLYRRNQAF